MIILETMSYMCTFQITVYLYVTRFSMSLLGFEFLAKSSLISLHACNLKVMFYTKGLLYDKIPNIE